MIFSTKYIREAILDEYSNSPFTPVYHLTLPIIASASQLFERILDKSFEKLAPLFGLFVLPVFVVAWHLPFAFIGVWMAVLGLKHKEPKTKISEATQKLDADIHASASRRLKFSFRGAPRTYMILGGVLIAILDLAKNGSTALNHARDVRSKIRTDTRSEIEIEDLSKLRPGERRILEEIAREARKEPEIQKPHPVPSNTPIPENDQRHPTP